MTDQGIVYRVLNTINHKTYIGVTTQPINERLGEHLGGRGSQLVLNAIQKYGKDAFRFDVIEESVPESKLKEFEKTCIKVHDCIAPKGYNLTGGGDGVFNPSELTRQRMSKSNKSKGKNHPMYGKKHTPESIEKITQASIGRKHTAEFKQQASERWKGDKNPHSGGMSDEHKKKLRKPKKTPRIPSADEKQRISASMKEVWAKRSQEEKQSIVDKRERTRNDRKNVGSDNLPRF